MRAVRLLAVLILLAACGTGATPIGSAPVATSGSTLVPTTGPEIIVSTSSTAPGGGGQDEESCSVARGEFDHYWRDLWQFQTADWHQEYALLLFELGGGVAPTSATRIDRFEDLASEEQELADELASLANSKPSPNLWTDLSAAFVRLAEASRRAEEAATEESLDKGNEALFLALEAQAARDLAAWDCAPE